MEKNILWFNVSVYDVAIIEHLITSAEVFEETPDELLRAVRVMVDVLFEGASITVFHDQIKIVCAWDFHLYAIHKVRVCGYLFQSLYLGFNRV